MPVLQVDNPLIENYLAQFDRLNPEEQRIVFAKLGRKRIVVEKTPRTKPKPKRSFEELCGVWGKEEDREDVDRMVAAIHEGRLLGTERESL